MSIQCDAAVTVTATDTGSGIPRPSRRRWSTTSAETTQATDSTHVAQALVEGYGGTLELTENSPAGTTFSVTPVGHGARAHRHGRDPGARGAPTRTEPSETGGHSEPAVCRRPISTDP